MFDFIKHAFRRRRQRAITDAVLARWRGQGTIVSRGILDCHACGERVHELSRRYEKRTLTGERLSFDEHIAYVCRLCQTVSQAADCSLAPVHVARWSPPHVD